MTQIATLSFTLPKKHAKRIKEIAKIEQVNRSWLIDFLCDHALESMTAKELRAAIKADPRSKTRVRN